MCVLRPQRSKVSPQACVADVGFFALVFPMYADKRHAEGQRASGTVVESKALQAVTSSWGQARRTRESGTTRLTHT